jgi:hypothetical protein
MSIYLLHEKNAGKYYTYDVFELRRPFDLENSVKVTVYDLENSKSTRPATS